MSVLYGLVSVDLVPVRMLSTPTQADHQTSFSVPMYQAERAAEIIVAANPGSSDGGNGGGGTPEPEPQPTSGRQIHPNGDNAKCLTVTGQPTDGSAVV
jgi:hypothetical protein